MRKIKLAIAALMISSTIISCGGSNANTTVSEDVDDPEIKRIDGILIDCNWVGLSNRASHIVAFDGKMFIYVIRDVQDGYVREDGRYTGTYKIEKGENNNYYVTITRNNENVMFLFTKNEKDGYYLKGEINLWHQSKT
ncbi:MAG: hypothetical protein WC756_04950 [Taibaiella sp.]|jgi:hypothetical protein